MPAEPFLQNAGGTDIAGEEGLFCIGGTTARSDGAADLTDFLPGCMA